MASSVAERSSQRHVLDRLGIFPPLAWGYVGLLLFMIRDGVESGYLSPFLIARGMSQADVAAVFTVYGVTAAVAAWFSGALSDLWGPSRVMWTGLCIWIVFEILFLTVLGSHALVASVTVPLVGAYPTLWISLGLVLAGGLIALLGLREPSGRRRLAPEGENPLKTVLSSVTIAWREPKTAIGCVVRIINTAPQFGFLVFLPIYFTTTVGVTLTQWLRLLSSIFLSNIVWNLLFGIIGDQFGWRRTVALCGGVGSAITTLALYYVPHVFGANYPLCILAGVCYGATLAGYVPLSALMPSLVPHHRGAAMSMLARISHSAWLMLSA